MARADDDAAGDVLETLKKAHRASSIKDLVFPALALSAQHDDTAPKTEWVVGRRGSHVLGVGDEELVLGGGRSKEEEQRVKRSRDEKLAILRKLLPITQKLNQKTEADKYEQEIKRLTPTGKL